MIVPTLKDRSHAPRGNAAMDALRPLQSMTQSVTGGIPTRSVGTISYEAQGSNPIPRKITLVTVCTARSNCMSDNGWCSFRIFT